MFKPRPQHIKNLSVDMAAMCDVGFLILVFFILAAHPKIMMPISLESPTVEKRIIGDEEPRQAIIYIGDGKVMFSLDNENLKAKTLVQMGEKYHINFTAQEISKFKKINIIGVPISDLKRYIDGYYKEQSFYNQPGVPRDASSYELTNWINESRKAYKALYDKDLDFSIDGDKSIKYPDVNYVINVLGSMHIYSFDLLTLHTALKK